MNLLVILSTILQIFKAFGFILWSFLAHVIKLCHLPFSKNNLTKTLPDYSCDIVLITGGAQGLGRELSLHFSDCGATVILWDINESKLRQTVSEITAQGREAFGYVVDCSNKEQIYQTAERVREEVGNVSILVNNVGVVFGKKIMDCVDEQVEMTFKINTLSYYWTTKAFFQWMSDNNYGYIINICSILAFDGQPQLWDYSASKSATLSYSESLRKEIHDAGKNGINVTVICPWHINTGMFNLTSNIHSFAPPLSAKHLAKDIVISAYERKFCVVFPSRLYPSIFLKLLLPVKAYDEILSILGYNSQSKLEVKNYFLNNDSMK